MSAAGQSNSGPYIIAIILLFVIARIRSNIVGVRVALGRTLLTCCVLSLFSLLLILDSFVSGVPVYMLAPYAAVAAASGAVSFRIVGNRLLFWKDSTGTVFYNWVLAVYLVYVVALAVRIAVELYFFGPQFFSFGSSALTLTTSTLYALIVTDFLLMLGIGLVIGRNARVLQKYRAI